VSVPPRCGPEEEAVGADEPDDPQPERIAAQTAARMTGADSMKRNFEPIRRQVETRRVQERSSTTAKLTIQPRI